VSLDDDALGELLDHVGIGLDLNAVGSTLEPLMAAIIDSAPPAAVQQAANRAVEALWDHELQAEVRSELTAFRNEGTEPTSELVATLDTALAALGRPASENQVAHALIWRATAELMRRVNRSYDRMAGLEKALAHARPNQHRALALSVAVAASLAVDVGDEEDAKAIARYLVEIASDPNASRKRSQRAAASMARSLATDERRQSMRTALAELVAVSADEFPLAAAALNKLLAEPVPDDPAKDELWMSLVAGLAEEQFAAAISTGPRG
jgi:uncharacterized protein (UPF0147 family)